MGCIDRGDKTLQAVSTNVLGSVDEWAPYLQLVESDLVERHLVLAVHEPRGDGLLRLPHLHDEDKSHHVIRTTDRHFIEVPVL